MARKKTTKRKTTTKKRTMKNKLVGFTKVGSKYALVYKKGSGKPFLGKSRFSSKKTLAAKARKLLK